VSGRTLAGTKEKVGPPDNMEGTVTQRMTKGRPYLRERENPVKKGLKKKKADNKKKVKASAERQDGKRKKRPSKGTSLYTTNNVALQRGGMKSTKRESNFPGP